MKTKILNEDKFNIVLKNKNFRNNQNYILGKTEKKKLLSKFFIENFFLKIYRVMNISKNSINYEHIYILLIIFSLLFPFVVIYLNIFPITFGILYIIFSFLLVIVLNYKSGTNINNIKSFSLKKIFISKEINVFSLIIVLGFFLMFFIASHTDNFIYQFEYGNYFSYIFYIIFGLFILFYKKTFKIFFVSIIQILFIPIYLIIFLYLLISNYIYIFLFKQEKGYLFIKYKPFLNIFKNNDYKIIEK